MIKETGDTPDKHELSMYYGDTIDLIGSKVTFESGLNTVVKYDKTAQTVTAVSTGTVKGKADGAEFTIEVKAHPVDIMLFAGQSNMVGSPNNAEADTVIPVGAAGEAPSVFAEASAPDAEGGLSAVRLEGQARPLTDEEIQAAYFRAEEAYGWFSLETLPCGEKTQTIDGWLYYPVEYPGMENLADLRAYLRGLFSEELVDALLASGGAHPLYQDVDGALYVLPTSRERDESKGQADIQIKPYGQAGYSVIVEVDLLADGGSTVTGVESYAFPYEFLEDRWVFTDFHLIY